MGAWVGVGKKLKNKISQINNKQLFWKNQLKMAVEWFIGIFIGETKVNRGQPDG